MRKLALPLLLLALAAAAVVLAIRFAGDRGASRLDEAKLWSWLRWAARHSAYGDEAVEAAGELEGPDARGIVEFGLARFEDAWEDDDRAIRALGVLARRGEPGLVPRIENCVEEGGEAFVGEMAARALAPIPGPEALALLSRLAGSDDLDAKRGALLALAGRPEPEAREVVRAALADPDEEIAALAAGVLAAAGEPAGERAAGEALDKEDGFLDEALALGLGAAPSAAARPWLDRLLERDTADSRAAAARALGRYGKTAPADVLTRLLSDSPPVVRLAAAAALARALGSAAGAGELVRAVDEEPDFDLRIEALRALAALRREADRHFFETWFRLPVEDEVHRRIRIWAAAALLHLDAGR